MDMESQDGERPSTHRVGEAERIRVSTEQLREDMNALLGILRDLQPVKPSPAEPVEHHVGLPDRRP